MKAIYVPFDKNKSVEVEKGYVVDNYLGENLNLGYSVVRTHLNGKHPLMKNTLSKRTYYFLKGSGRFDVDGEIFDVKEGDTLTIEKDTIYTFEGNFDAILFSCPAFNAKFDVVYK